MPSCKGEGYIMSSFVENTSNWRVYEEDYELFYSLTHSVNHSFEEFELEEYGISCVLYNKDREVLSTAEVEHISSDLKTVLNYIRLITKNKVFPVHLLDVVSDLLDERYLI